MCAKTTTKLMYVRFQTASRICRKCADTVSGNVCGNDFAIIFAVNLHTDFENLNFDVGTKITMLLKN